MRPIQLDHLIMGKRLDLVLINKKILNCHVDFAVLADYWVKIKESEKMDKYLDLAIELKKLWNIKVKLIPVEIGVLGTVPKSLEKGLTEVKISRRSKTTALLSLARILRRVLETKEDLLSLRLQRKTTR